MIHHQEEVDMTQKRLTKAQVVAEIAEMSELDKKSVNRVFESLTEIIKKQLGSRGPGEFVIPGLLKLKVRKTKAIPAGPRYNPFTKQMENRPAKPPQKKIGARALKSLKDLIQ
jgi:DNA-binding protein HU-beta